MGLTAPERSGDGMGESVGLGSSDADREGGGRTLSSSNVRPPGPPRIALGGGPRWLIDCVRPCPPAPAPWEMDRWGWWECARRVGGGPPRPPDPMSCFGGSETDGWVTCVLGRGDEVRGSDRLLWGKWPRDERAVESSVHARFVNGRRGEGVLRPGWPGCPGCPGWPALSAPLGEREPGVGVTTPVCSASGARGRPWVGEAEGVVKGGGASALLPGCWR